MSDSTEKTIDCVVCGSCVVDMLVKPVPLDRAIGGGKLVRTEPIEVTTGGIVSNSGIAMTRLGMKAAAFTYVGDDDWGPIITRRYEAEGMDASRVAVHPTAATSTTAVLIDASGERSFMHCVGAPKQMNKQLFLDNLDLFAKSRMTLVGYYSLMPMQDDLPEVFAAIRAMGCQTALDAAGDGGTMQPLDRILPHLDVYCPSHNEAAHQTGESDPEKIIDAYRACGAPGVLGVKLGSDGALLSAAAGEYVKIDAVPPPGGEVVDTTGAGDSFYAGLLTGLLRGMSITDAGRLAAATGSCCVTGIGATAGLRDYNETARLAGIDV